MHALIQILFIIKRILLYVCLSYFICNICHFLNFIYNIKIPNNKVETTFKCAIEARKQWRMEDSAVSGLHRYFYHVNEFVLYKLRQIRQFGGLSGLHCTEL